MRHLGNALTLSLLGLTWLQIRAGDTVPRADALPERAVARLGVVRPRWNYVTAHAFPSTHTLITADDSLNVFHWDIASGRILRHQQFPCADTAWPRLSADGKILAARDWGGAALRLYDLQTGKQIGNLTAPGVDSLWEFEISGDGRFVAGIAHTKKALSAHLWDTLTGKAVPLHSDKGYVQPPRFSPLGNRVVAMVDDVPKCWDAASGKLIWIGERVRTVDPSVICFTPDGKYVLARSGSPESPPIWWDAETGKIVSAKTGSPGSARSLIEYGPVPRLPIFSANGRTMITVREAQMVRVMDTGTGEMRKEIANIDGILGLAADGRTLIGWAPGGIPQCWNTETGKALWPEIPDRSHAGNVSRVEFSPNGRLLVSVGADGEARIWDVDTRTVLSKHSTAPGGPVLFSSDGRFLFLCSASDIIQWDVVNHQSVRRLKVMGWAIEQTKGFVGLALSRDQISLTALADLEKEEWLLSAWTIASGEQVVQKKLDLAGNRLALWPGEAILSQKGEVCDARNAKVLFAIQSPRDDMANRWCGRTVVAQSGAMAVCAAEPAKPGAELNPWPPPMEQPAPSVPPLCVIDTEIGRVVQTIQTEKTGVFELSPNGRWLAMIEPHGFGIWETSSGRHVQSFAQTGVRSLAFNPNNHTIATGLANGTVIIWDLTPVGFHAKSEMTSEELQETWTHLTGADCARALEAIWLLTAAKSDAVAFLATQLKSITPVSDEHLQKLISDLDSSRYAVREAALRELAGLGDRALPAVRKAKRGSLSQEAQWRVDRLLNRRFIPLSSQTVQFLRAVEVLERIGSPEARQELTKLSAGDPRVIETRAVREALEHLSRKQ